MALNESMEQYARQCQDELRALIRALCAIPAPSHHEQQRAEFCRQWLERAGGRNVWIDEALNVICPWGDTGDNPLTVVMAHTDTVFPDREPMALREADRLAVLAEGVLCRMGTPEEILDCGVLERSFHVAVERVRTEDGWRYYCRKT